ncbi:hypothetical protein NBRC111894_3431 [Sporolactobacillus inulinus]|uniref:Uncharacterized protein n=1 Tax=Sporolactobacillus inulinus TaxID=2078 RepID=A0A4Y1ZFG1_9BACL|nr:hypothetical protein NBRC111894_3431 [Sporolactobacillus inulinus]
MQDRLCPFSTNFFLPFSYKKAKAKAPLTEGSLLLCYRFYLSPFAILTNLISRIKGTRQEKNTCKKG